MAVVKLSSSGTGVMFVLGEDAHNGTVFIVSKVMLDMLLSGHSKGPFIRLSKFALPTSSGKFPASEVWGDAHTDASEGRDSFSKDFRKERKDREVYSKSKTVKLK